MRHVLLPRPELCPACHAKLPRSGPTACGQCEWAESTTPLEHRVSSLLHVLDDLDELEDWEVMALLCRARRSARERRTGMLAPTTRP